MPRRRFSAGESRLLRRLAREGKSIQEALRRFRAGGKRRIGNKLFRSVFRVLRDAVQEGIRVGNLNKIDRGSLSIANLKKVVGGVAGKVKAGPVIVTATGYAVGTAVAGIQNRTYDVPYQTAPVTVRFRLDGLERLLLNQEVTRRVLIATEKARYQAALSALKAADSDFADAAASYGRIQVTGGGDVVISNISTQPVG